MIRDLGRIEGRYRAGRLTWRAEGQPLVGLLAQPRFEEWLREESEIILRGKRLPLEITMNGGGEDVSIKST